MANPVVSIGTPGTSQYRVDYGPQQRDQALAFHGIQEIFRGIKDFADRRNTATLSEMLTAKADHDQLVDFAGKRGLLPQLGEMLTARKALAPPVQSPYTLAPGAARYGPGGEEIARNPAAPTTDKGFTLGPGQVRHDAAGNVLARGPDKPPPAGKPFETEQKLRKEYSGESDVFRKTQDSFRRVISSADGKSAAGELALIFNFMKTLDPGSVVRESEFALAASAGNFGERIKAAVDQVTVGTRLTAKQRADFVQTAQRAYLGQADQQERRRLQYTGIAESYGLDPGRALANYLDADILKRVRQTPPASAPAPAAAAPRQYMQGGGTADARTATVMQSLGLGGPNIPTIPVGGPAPAQASTMDPRFMGDAGLVTGGSPPPRPAAPPGFDPQARPPTGPARFSSMDLSGLKAINNPAGLPDEEYNAYLARLRAIAGR